MLGVKGGVELPAESCNKALRNRSKKSLVTAPIPKCVTLPHNKTKTRKINVECGFRGDLNILKATGVAIIFYSLTGSKGGSYVKCAS